MSDLVKMSDIINIYNTYDSEEAREQVMKLPSINAVIIPENATNGDMIKALFPQGELKGGFYGIEGLPLVCLNFHTEAKSSEVFCLEEWWNAPYKKGESE